MFAAENVYRQSQASDAYRRVPGSFEVVSPFSSQPQPGRRTGSGTPNAQSSPNNNSAPSCAYGHSLYGGGGGQARSGTAHSNANKYIPQAMGMGIWREEILFVIIIIIVIKCGDLFDLFVCKYKASQ